MIKIKKNDTLIDIVEKIESFSGEDIILQFPIGHSILHNYLSLKIIKSKSGKKKLTIVTGDILSRKIGKRLGINYTIIKDSEYIEHKNALSKEDSLMKHNFSFVEYFIFEIKKYYQEFLNTIKRNKKINNIRTYSQKYKSYSNIGIFVGLFLVSLFLFIFIFYFAINKTTITITPEIIVKKNARNFIFEENNDFSIFDNDKKIKISQITETVQLKDTYSTTGIDESSIKRASGKIKISNLLTQEIKLLPETRFATDEGIIFDIENWITVPPAIVDNFGTVIPGTIETTVVGKSYDLEGRFIGERGNISTGTKLKLPGLKDEGKTVFATTLEDFSGGGDGYSLIVSEKDMENTLLIFEQKVKNKLVDSLKEKIKQRNITDKSLLDILSIDDIIEYSDLDISVKNNLEVGDTSDSITLEGSIKGKTYIYNKQEIINKLKTVVQEGILEGVETILLIDEKSLRISSIIYRKRESFEVKATVEIDTLISHDFLNKDNSYTEKLKDTIKGLTKQEAIKLLLNDPRISNVSINIRPFFLKNISNISENIIFDIEKN